MNICDVEGCGDFTRYPSGKLCNKHYLRQSRYGRLHIVRKPKVVRKNEVKSIAEVKRLVKEVFELYKDDSIRIKTLIDIFTE